MKSKSFSFNVEKFLRSFVETGEVETPKQFNLMEIAEESSTAQNRLFNELDEKFAEAPEWIPFLPKPGNYEHTEYGLISVSPDRNANFVKNYQEGVYQKFLPIDLEHDLPNSGAVGHIEDFKTNEDGSVHAKVNWNVRGKTLIEQDRFRYFSPAWKDQWTDSVDGKVYKDVAVGGALCERPFFKDKSLGPIVCKDDDELYFTESTSFKEGDKIKFEQFERKEFAFPAFLAKGKKKGEVVPPDEEDDDEEEDTPAVNPFAKKKGNKKMTEDTTKTSQTVEMSDDVKRMFAEKDSQINSLTEAVKAASEAILSMKDATDDKRFTDLVMGNGGESDGLRWAGEPSKNVEVLKNLAKTSGENSEVFKDHVSNMTAIAAQMKRSNLFSEIGRTVTPSATSTLGKLDTLVAKRMSEVPGTSREKARSDILKENPQYYSEFLQERS